MAPPATITQLLIKWRDGDKAALEELARQIYGELRGLARYYLRQERAGHTLQPSDLVHEAYLRLVDESETSTRLSGLTERASRSRANIICSKLKSTP